MFQFFSHLCVFRCSFYFVFEENYRFSVSINFNWNTKQNESQICKPKNLQKLTPFILNREFQNIDDETSVLCFNNFI